LRSCGRRVRGPSPGGTFATTGIGGLTLGGGIGYLLGRFGLACDSLVGAQIVTADGRVVERSEDEEAELFWAIRGGGGNFGIATRLDCRLHFVDTVVGGMLIYRIAGAGEIVRRFRDVMADAPDHLTCQLSFGADHDGREPGWPSVSFRSVAFPAASSSRRCMARQSGCPRMPRR
jgi:FAD/FMN-containing dehydrogenase